MRAVAIAAVVSLVLLECSSGHHLTATVLAPTTTATTAAHAPTTTTDKIEVPDVLAMTREQAAKTIGAVGFRVAEHWASSAAPKGIIVSQSPKAGTDLPRGSMVVIAESNAHDPLLERTAPSSATRP